MKNRYDLKRKIGLYLIVIFCITKLPLKTYSQLNEDHMWGDILRYWYYSERLNYFTVPGTNLGEGYMAGIRNQIGNSAWESMNYDQQAEYLGNYIGVLATQYKILSDNQQEYGMGYDCNNTLANLYYSLQTYLNQMDNCEGNPNIPCYGGSNSPKPEGFFIRCYMPPVTGFFLPPWPSGGTDLQIVHSQELNFGLNSTNLYEGNGSFNGLPPGKPGWINYVSVTDRCEDMSQDEAIDLLMGLALVAKFIPTGSHPIILNDGSTVSYDIRGTAVAIADAIVKWININGDWHIYKPDRATLVPNGSDAEAYAFALATTATKFTGYPIDTYMPSDQTGYDIEWQTLTREYNNVTSDDAMALTLASMCDCYYDPPGIQTTGYCIKELAQNPALEWDDFYLLLWSALNDKSSNDYVQDILQGAINLLNVGPCEGPYFYDASHYAGSGWCTSDRWHHTNYEQNNGESGTFYGNYNGLDYMLLMNLYLIASNSIYKAHYMNYTYRNLSGYYPNKFLPWSEINGDAANPINFVSLDQITSNTQFNNYLYPWGSISPELAHGTFEAANSITLTPGFKVETGAYFHGFINDNISCTDFSITSKVAPSNNNGNNINIDKNDSITKIKNTTANINLTVSPNPSNGNMQVAYEIPQNANGTFSIYDLMGKQILSYPLSGGKNTLTISGANIDAGIYFYRATAGNKIIGKDKIVVIK